jgi:hypothetical protein
VPLISAFRFFSKNSATLPQDQAAAYFLKTIFATVHFTSAAPQIPGNREFEAVQLKP